MQLPCSVQEPWIVSPTDRALLLYSHQRQCHLLIIGLHSLVAVLFLFISPLPQQRLISPASSIPDDLVHNIDTNVLTYSYFALIEGDIDVSTVGLNIADGRPSANTKWNYATPLQKPVI